MKTLSNYKDILQLIKSILHFLKNGWKLVHIKPRFLIISRRSKSIQMNIENKKTWIRYKTQHIQFSSQGLFLSFAYIRLESIRTTVKNLRNAMLFTMNFCRKPTAYKMATVTFDSVVVGCSYDKAIFKGPFLENSSVSFFTVHRSHRGQNLALHVEFWICKQCGPHFAIFSEKSQKSRKVFHDSSAINVVDHCIDKVAGKVFLNPALRWHFFFSFFLWLK